MNLSDIHNICKALPGTTTDIKWEDHLCFNVGGKMYLITSPDQHPISASFKVSEDKFATLCEKEGVVPAPYLARYKWVQIDDISKLSNKEWSELIPEAYVLIFSRLPAKVKKAIEG